MSIVTLHDGKQVRLGRKSPVTRPNALAFANYLTDVVPPSSVDYSPKATAAISQMYMNDTYGDCTTASMAHQVGIWTGNEVGTPLIATDEEIKKIYFRMSPRDDGCLITDVLDAWKVGFTLGGSTHSIDGYVAIDWTNRVEVEVALATFGGLSLGINLPAAWAKAETTWDVVRSPIEGGHAILAFGYSEEGVQIATWGGQRTITWRAFLAHTWVEEAYCVLSPDWYSVANTSPTGVDLATLKADLAKLANGDIPPIGPAPSPTPTPLPQGPSLDEVVGWFGDGVEAGKPYGAFGFGNAYAVQAFEAGVANVHSNWPG